MFDWDVVIIGGSQAVLTAGLYLAWARRRVILLEKETPLADRQSNPNKSVAGDAHVDSNRRYRFAFLQFQLPRIGRFEK